VAWFALVVIQAIVLNNQLRSRMHAGINVLASYIRRALIPPMTLHLLVGHLPNVRMRAEYGRGFVYDSDNWSERKKSVG